MIHAFVRLSSLAVSAALVSFAPAVRAQYMCTAPGLAVTPVIDAWQGTLPVSFFGLSRATGGGWTGVQFSTVNPFHLMSTIRDYQNQVTPCAPPATGHAGTGKVTGAVPPAVASQIIAFGNLDGSANTSAVVINSLSSDDGVTVYIGNGNYMPTSVTTYETGGQPASVALADLNGDGKLDIVVAESGGGSNGQGDVAVLLNKGGGVFQPAVKYAAGNGPISIAIGDVNGDGAPDIVVANNNDGTVSVLLGSSNGTFAAPANYSVGALAQGIILADFNGDGNLDIAVGAENQAAGTYQVSVLLNKGNGKFAKAVAFAAPRNPSSLVAWDFDGDGNLDLAAADGSGNEVGILHGNGDGTFVWTATYAVDLKPASLVVTDFNNDGIADIVVASGNDSILGPDTGSGNISVLLGNGDGTFRGTKIYPAGEGTNSVTIADFNKDGNADLVVANQFGNPFVELYQGNGDGTFGAGTILHPFGAVKSLVSADFDNDGNPDLAAIGANGSVLVARGDGHGGFAPTTSTTVSGAPAYLAVGDFDGNGIPDLLVASNSTSATALGSVSVLLGNGDGTFKTPTSALTGVPAIQLATGDFNLDGNTDAAVVVKGNLGTQIPGSVVILKGKGDGTFTAGPSMSVGPQPEQPFFAAVGDVNGDGKPDLVVLFQYFTPIYGLQVFLGNGDGTFQALAPVTTGQESVSVVISDFNGDGRPDLVISHCCGATDMTYMLGNGDGTFQPETEFSAGIGPSAIAMGELNGDGVQDLAIANYETQGLGYVTIVPGAGLRTQSAASFAFMPLAPDSIVACFGHDLATGTLASTASSLLGTSVNVRDSAGVSRPATLTFVDSHQVNYIIPDGTANGLATTTVHSGDGTSTSTQYYVSGSSPGIFAMNGAGLVAADVLRVHSDGTSAGENIYSVVNNQVVPNPLNLGVAAGDTVFLEIFGTGFRSVSQANMRVTIGGVNAPVSFVGAQGSPGLDQLNVQVPTSVAGRGSVAVVVTANGTQVANVTNFVVQ